MIGNYSYCKSKNLYVGSGAAMEHRFDLGVSKGDVIRVAYIVLVFILEYIIKTMA